MLFLIQFYEEWNDFRMAELMSLFALYGISESPDKFPPMPTSPIGMQGSGTFLFVELPSYDVVRMICQRAVLINRVIEIWSHSITSFDDLASTASGIRSSSVFIERGYDTMLSTMSWSLLIESFAKSVAVNEKEQYRKGLVQFTRPLTGPVRVVNPDITMILLLDFSFEKKPIEPNTSPTPCYFGRLIARGGMREALRKYDLKKRLYIGPTSLDPSLGFIMANLGHVDNSSIAFDPFVGTGSILIALSHFGAISMGADIDLRVLDGEMYAGTGDRNVKRDIFENFKSYNLPRPELIRLDNHLLDRHFLSTRINHASAQRIHTSNDVDRSVSPGMYNAIVTDPPYGIRAGAKKTGKKHLDPVKADQILRHNHIPPVQSYSVEEVILDLLHNAARTLIVGGRLVYLIPTPYDFTLADLPHHPCLQIVSMCEQPLSTRHSRRCVVVVKVREYSIELEEDFQRYKIVVLSGKDEGFGRLKSKLEAALSTKAFDDDSVVKVISNACSRRRASVARKKESSGQWREEHSHVNVDVVPVPEVDMMNIAIGEKEVDS